MVHKGQESRSKEQLDGASRLPDLSDTFHWKEGMFSFSSGGTRANYSLLADEVSIAAHLIPNNIFWTRALKLREALDYKTLLLRGA